jgi:hypothetical protein
MRTKTSRSVYVIRFIVPESYRRERLPLSIPVQKMLHPVQKIALQVTGGSHAEAVRRSVSIANDLFKLLLIQNCIPIQKIALASGWHYDHLHH